MSWKVQLKDLQKIKKDLMRGKQGEHTLKTQVVFGRQTGKIICLAHEKGKTHDFRLFKKSNVKFHNLLKIIADKGYQGIAKLHKSSETPIKKPRGGKLTRTTETI